MSLGDAESVVVAKEFNLTNIFLNVVDVKHPVLCCYLHVHFSHFIMHPRFHQLCSELLKPPNMEKIKHPTGQQFLIKCPPNFIAQHEYAMFFLASSAEKITFLGYIYPRVRSHINQYVTMLIGGHVVLYPSFPIRFSFSTLHHWNHLAKD